MVPDSDENQFKESVKKFTSIFHRKNRGNCESATSSATKDELSRVEKCDLFKKKLKYLFKKEHQTSSIGSNSNSGSFEVGSEENQSRGPGNRFASFFQTENREYFDAGTELTVDSDILRVKKRIILKNKFKELFQKKKKTYFPAPCSEYDSSAPVTLTTGDMVSDCSNLKVRKRDIFKKTFKSIFKINKEDKKTELDHVEQSKQVNQECSFGLGEDCEIPRDLQYEEESAQAYAYVFGDDASTPNIYTFSKIVLPKRASKTVNKYDDINESGCSTSSSCYSSEILRQDEFTTPLPSILEYNNEPNLSLCNSEDPYKPFANYDNYQDSFIYPTKLALEVKESKFKNGIKKIISFIKNSFPTLSVFFST